MNTIRIDFNDLARGGKVVALKSWADGPVALGDHVIAFDEIEDLRYSAVVAEEDTETGEIYLELGDELPSPDQVPAPTHRVASTLPPIQFPPSASLSYTQRETLAAFKRQLRQNPDLQRSIDDVRRTIVPAFTTVHHFQTRMPEGYLLRYELDAMQDLRLRAAKYFQAVSKPGSTRAWDLFRQEVQADLIERVVIACLPHDTINSVLGQMEENTAVAVAMPVENSEGIWTASTVSGIARQGTQEPTAELLTLTSVGLTLDSTISEFMEASGALDALAKAEVATGGPLERIAWGRVLLVA
ncbi:hypothetical protein [Rhodococcus globerulus]|uniref:hypothetical protein n=1 Tax=Rhodococcus globerulus TaxID=33008 RepID=UPI001C57C13D|nr:hypothetical protein [Rhodococcus globerulus]QXW04052.1 hypothetical protein KYT97_08535 [Rhodococcus globerulus]